MPVELGLIEGCYGRPWSWAERREAVAFLAPHGYRFFLYAPKADAFLRRRWREPHPDAEAAALADLRDACRAHGVRFGVGLSPYALHADFDAAGRLALADKLERLDDAGVEDLALLFDDMRGDVADLAARQLEIVAFAAERTRASRLLFCPTYYSDDPVLDRVFGRRPDGYLADLGRGLDAAIHVMWTGEEVCSREFSAGGLDRVCDELRRQPFLWDNYPVNDGPWMSRHLHLRAFAGRPAAVLTGRVAAHGINVASQAVLTRIPALTLAENYARGDRYSYGGAFRRAASQVLGDALADLVAADIHLLEDEGLGTPVDRLARLRARYAAHAHPAAAEILAWIDGAHVVDPETPDEAA